MYVDKNKYKCGPITNSSCVPYTGKDLTFLAKGEELGCDANLNEVIDRIDIHLKELVDGNNLTGLDKGCLDFDPATVTPAQLHQLEIAMLCEHDTSIKNLQSDLTNLSIGSKTISIDLPECLDTVASDCAVGTNQYQLVNLLILFANKLCDHETRISNLES